MVDATLTAGQNGIYEQPLPAGTTVTISIAPAGLTGVMLVNLGTTPIYYQPGTTVTARDPNAKTIPPGLFADTHVIPGGNTVIAFTSTVDTTFSVIRK